VDNCLALVLALALARGAGATGQSVKAKSRALLSRLFTFSNRLFRRYCFLK